MTEELKPPDPENPFLRQISAKANRKLKAQHDGVRNAWLGLGVIGLVGWSVAIPTLLGLGLGLWLDRCCPGAYGWTLNLLLLGLLVGCLNAWHWVTAEDKAMHDEDDKHE